MVSHPMDEILKLCQRDMQRRQPSGLFMFENENIGQTILDAVLIADFDDLVVRRSTERAEAPRVAPVCRWYLLESV
ncbi:hypothetical protein ASD64_13725 [Mesorhizobium sp. Root157]|nr:hypothetical protein ASD64_13725 [Mesorhizobium sp. Root157]